MSSRTFSNKSGYGKGKPAMPAVKLMAFENEYHRHVDALLREVKRLRGEVGVLAKRYNGAKGEIKELVERVMRQAPPPIPVRPEKKREQRQQKNEVRGEEEVEKADVVTEEAVQEEDTPGPTETNTEKLKERAERRERREKKKLKKALLGKSGEKQKKAEDPPTTPIPSSTKLPEQVAEAVQLPASKTEKTERKRRFLETNDTKWWVKACNELKEKTGGHPTKVEMQKYAVEEGIEGDKVLLLLPISAEGRKDYVLQERMYEVKEFQYGEWYAAGIDGELWDASGK